MVRGAEIRKRRSPYCLGERRLSHFRKQGVALPAHGIGPASKRERAGDQQDQGNHDQGV